MTNIFIIHGTHGSPEENWFPWLKKELENLGYKVFVPQFPLNEKQNLNAWLKVFREYEDKVDKDTILVGHSVGATFILDYLEQTDKKVKASFLVAGFTGGLPNYELRPLLKTFSEKRFNWAKIKKSSRRFYIFHSDNDPAVPSEKAQFLSEKLGTKIIWIKNAGHFNKKSGYLKFDKLLEEVNKELQIPEKRNNVMVSHIELNAFVKLKGLATTGGQAKLLIQSGQVLVNGVPETQNKKKLVENDSVECEGQKFKVKKEECKMEKKDKKKNQLS